MGNQKLFQKIDSKVLKKSPFQWIIGWHIFLPILFLLALLGIIVGSISSTKIYTHSPDSIISLSLLLGFLALIVFIFFVIRQIKFNSFRIHHHIPYANSISTYFSFWLILIPFVLIPFIPYETYTFRIQNKLDKITESVEEDIDILDEGIMFFYSRNNKPNEGSGVIHKFSIEFESNEIRINNVFDVFNYSNYKDSYQGETLIIKKEEAIQRIEDFIIVAKRYEIELKDTDPYSILKKREAFNYENSEQKYDLFTIDKSIKVKDYDSNFYSYKNMMNNYKNNSEFQLHNFYAFFTVIMYSAILALLLWIVISVEIGDFGFAVLAAGLISMFLGIFMAIVAIFNNGFVFGILYFAILVIFLIAFAYQKQNRVKRVFQILSQVSIPMFVGILIIQFGFDFKSFDGEPNYFLFLISMLSVVCTVFVYKFVYKASRILPK